MSTAPSSFLRKCQDIPLKFGRRRHFNHDECNLFRIQVEDPAEHIIDAGILIDLRRWWCKQKIMSPKHPHALFVYKSETLQKKEQAKQILNYKWSIHPFSNLNLVWEYIFFFVYIYMMMVYMMMGLFIDIKTYNLTFHLLRCIGDVFYLADLIHFFFEGYYDVNQSKAVLKPSRIAKKYLKTYFFIDLIALYPTLVFIIKLFSKGFDWLSVNFVWNWAGFLGLIRFLRLKRFLTALELIKKKTKWSDYTYWAVKAVMIYLSTMLILHCIVFIAFNDLNKIFEIEKRPKAREFLSTTLILCVVAGGVDIVPNEYYVIVVVISYFLGFSLNLFLKTQCLQIWNKFFLSQQKYDNIRQQLRQFMSYKALSLQFQKRVALYFSFKYQNNYYNERDFNQIISLSLREEIMSNIIQKHISQAQFFKNLPRFLLCRLFAVLISEIYLPDDVIAVAKDEATCMYFLYFGTVAVYDSKGTEICHLKDGDHFGETDMLFKHKRLHTVVAISPCEIFKLQYQDLVEVLRDYPSYSSKLVKNVHDKI